MKKLFKIVCFLFIYSLLSAKTNSQKVYITSVDKIDSFYSVTFNNLVMIKDIKIRKTKIGQREIISLEFPTYVSKRRKNYPQISILSKDLNERLLNCITVQKKENMPEDVPELSFRINKFSLYRSSKSPLKAFATVIFGDAFEIGCKIMESKKGIWISWPSKKDKQSNKWIKQVVFKSKEYKNRVENELIMRYKTMKVETKTK